MNKLIIISCLALFAGCAGQGVYEAKQVPGGSLTMVGYPQPRVDYGSNAYVQPEPLQPYVQLQQSANAQTPTEYTVSPDGTVSAKLGITRTSPINITAAPDNTKYWLLGVSVLAIAGGIYLMSSGWPTIGLRVLIAGIAGAVFSLTVDKYGWVYVLVALGLGGWIAYERYGAYLIGLIEPKAGTVATTVTAVPTTVVTTATPPAASTSTTTTSSTTPVTVIPASTTQVVASTPLMVPPANKPS